LAAAIERNSMSRRGEHLAQDRGNPLRFLVDLLFAQSLHFKSERAQLEISLPVLAVCLPPAVVPVAVGFDYETEIPPDEIRLILANLNVDFGQGQTVSPADPQEVALEVAAGAVVADVLTERQAEHLDLPNRPPHLGLRNSSTEVDDRLGRLSDRYSMTPSDVGGRKRFAAMQTDSRSPRSASIPADRGIDGAAYGSQQIPKLSGAPMTDNRTIAASESGGHPPTVLRDSGMADGIYAAVNPMQSACFNPAAHGISRDAGIVELLRRDHPVLPSRNSRDLLIWPGDFCVHPTHKSPGGTDAPP
jgi:hypothetical protein